MWSESIKERIRNMNTLTPERKVFNLGLIYDSLAENKDDPEAAIEAMIFKIKRGGLLAIQSESGFLRGCLLHYRDEVKANPLMSQESKLELLDDIISQRK